VDVGTSRAVTLPSQWLEFYRRKYGKPLEEVAVEVDEVLKIIPINPKNAKVKG